MPRSAAPHSNASITLAQHLADREGLKGAAREAFLRFMVDTLGFDREVRTHSWRLLAVVSCLLAVVGFVSDIWFVSTAGLVHGGLVWMPAAAAGLILASLFRRAERRARLIDKESHWRVYCLLLRPIVLAEKPGLLDRNLAADRAEVERIEIRPTETLRDMFVDGSADFWWSTVLGLWAGMVILLAGRFAGIFSGLFWAVLPIAGILLGPVVWALWQCLAFWWARRETRELR